jgi:hypothetical protein
MDADKDWNPVGISVVAKKAPTKVNRVSYQSMDIFSPF